MNLKYALRGLLLLATLALPLAADEGMWLFNAFPKDRVKEKYSFEVTDAFLAHLRLSSMRIGGGSGSFVSPHGLIFTNHHVASDCISKVSSAQHDYMKNGFYAAAARDELSCPDLEANVLVALEEVTAKVKADSPAKRAAAIARIETECMQKTANHCEVVKLFAGERYDLYQYKQYTDLRLVFAPEFGIAFFGGNTDNFEYPRYDLDIAFLRAYENGRPADTPNYLVWSDGGVKENELVFVAGNPGTTSRFATPTQLSFYRDTQLPFTISRLNARINALREFSATSEENRRAAERTLFGFWNNWKSSAGKYLGLKDDRLMARKSNLDRRLRKAVEADTSLGAEAGKVWDQVGAAYKTWAPNEKAYEVLERPHAMGSSLFRIARMLVRWHEERAKPNDQRVAEYRDSGRKSMELALFSPAPIDDGLEIVLLTQYLEELKALGDKEAPVKAILQSATPAQAAETIVRGTRLKSVAERKRLAGDKAELAKSGDPMIHLAQLLDPPVRKIRKKYEETIETLEASAVDKIAQYRFKVLGAGQYPDATFTPRIAFGAIKGYRDKTEAPLPFATTFGGMYHRAGKEPYILPARWADGKSQLDLVVPFDFVSTCDITGGDSGSPTVNQKGEIVGIVFDGNIESLPLTYLYSDEQARAVHVASQGIVEALRKLYKTPELLRELGQGGERLPSAAAHLEGFSEYSGDFAAMLFYPVPK
ncbi:MAG TPA: S46 family peptidase [Candidatus Acidoferrales bacterium]|nr:S46 family peptidase [Candidatus Acidoferrales bacterium]